MRFFRPYFLCSPSNLEKKLSYRFYNGLKRFLSTPSKLDKRE